MANQDWIRNMEHAQTKSYYVAFKELLKYLLFSNSTALELGLDWGISARAFLEDSHIIRLVSVDVNHRDGVDAVLRETGRMGIFQFMQMRTDDYFALPIPEQFDVIFIDADHTYEQVVKDLANAWERLKPGGWIIMHDVLHVGHFDGREDAYGVARAMIEHLSKYDMHGNIEGPYPGLAYFQKQFNEE